MLAADKKKLVALVVLIAVGIPGAFFVQNYSKEQVDSDVVDVASAQSPFQSADASVSKSNDKPISEDEIEPKYIAINKATDHLASQILAGSSNQVEALLNEGVKQSNRLATSMLQNKNIQVQLATADLAIKKSELEKIQIEGAIEKEKALISGEDMSTDTLLPPPVTKVEIPPEIQIGDTGDQPQETKAVEKIYEEFFVKGVSSDGINYAAVGSYRGKTVVLRVGSVLGGSYRVISITERTVMLEKSGETFEFTVNV